MVLAKKISMDAAKADGEKEKIKMKESLHFSQRTALFHFTLDWLLVLLLEIRNLYCIQDKS